MSDGPASAGALRARKTWRTLEPLHGMVYFVPEAAEAYLRLGITGRAGYFASRAAPMGAVQADVVVSTFFNFNPELVHAAIPSSWAVASPQTLVDARFAAVDAACRRILGDAVVTSEEMRRAADLARAAAAAAACRVEGRPLAAAHAEVVWPTEPHLVLWHAQSVLREFRGDGHVALLVTHGLSGIRGAGHPRSHRRGAGARAALDQGLARRGVGCGGRLAPGAGLAPDGRTTPPHRVGRGRAPDDRRSHGRAGGGTVRRARRGRLRGAARPRPTLEHRLRRTPALRVHGRSTEP